MTTVETFDERPALRTNSPSTVVQILTIIFYTGFAISVSIVAMAMFGPIGIVLALFMAWQWGNVAAFGRKDESPEATVAEPQKPTPTGNAAFDAYREDTLARLEAEQADFVAFLDRLREARDAQEFDTFLEARGNRTLEA